MSGCLVMIVSLGRVQRLQSVCERPGYWVRFVLHRYLRLTPVYMMVLLTSTALYDHLVQGPLKAHEFEEFHQCRTKWWAHALYINNFVEPGKKCMTWTWYLAVDMQFYIISPVFIYTVTRNKRIGQILICSGLFLSLIGAFVATCINGGQFIMMDLSFLPYWSYVYTMPWVRCGAFCVGLMLGVFLYDYQENKKQSHQHQQRHQQDQKQEEKHQQTQDHQRENLQQEKLTISQHLAKQHEEKQQEENQQEEKQQQEKQQEEKQQKEKQQEEKQQEEKQQEEKQQKDRQQEEKLQQEKLQQRNKQQENPILWQHLEKQQQEKKQQEVQQQENLHQEEQKQKELQLEKLILSHSLEMQQQEKLQKENLQQEKDEDEPQNQQQHQEQQQHQDNDEHQQKEQQTQDLQLNETDAHKEEHDSNPHDGNLCLTKSQALLGWTAAVGVALLIVFISHAQWREGAELWDSGAQALYEAFSRPVWSVCVAWVIYACSTGAGGIANTVLSWPAFRPASRLCYCMYLLHPVLITFITYSRRSTVYMGPGHWEIIYNYFGNLALTFLFAILFTLTFESPMLTLEKLLLR